MKLTIEGKPDEIKSVLKNLSATENSQEIQKQLSIGADNLAEIISKNLFTSEKFL